MTGSIHKYLNVYWIELDGGGRTEPGWTGILGLWKARRYAKRHGIELRN